MIFPKSPRMFWRGFVFAKNSDNHSKPRLVAILNKHGFVLDRQSDSHAIYIHPDGRRTTVPVHGKRDLGKGLLLQITEGRRA